MKLSPHRSFTALLTLLLLAAPASAEFGDTLFVAVAEQPQSIFGWMVNSAGDLNGDGYNDIAVGDATSDSGGIEAGRTYVYFTGSTIDEVPDLVITGTADYQWCGFPQRAGDFNGDGWDDLAVGASGYGGERGRALLYWGGPGLVGEFTAADADVKLTGESALNQDWFGEDNEPLGDVNGDGLDDLVIGAPNAGRAYVFFGDSTLSGIVSAVDADIILDISPRYLAKVGSGDLNGDSQPDLVLGSPYGGDGGRAYVFFGDSTRADTVLTAADADVVISGDGLGLVGATLACDGDLDGDGFDDLAVGSPSWSYPEDDGAVLVFYGRTVFPDSMLKTDADWVIEGEGEDFTLGDEYGAPALADQDGDGYDDLVVPAHAWGLAAGYQRGRAYLFVTGPVRRTGLTHTSEAQRTWTCSDPAGFGRDNGWVPNVIPGSTGAFVFGATAHWSSTIPGKVYVIDAGQGWTPVDARIVAPPEVGTRLLPCAPSPFGAATAIRFDLARSSWIDLAVYDVAGRLVRTLQSGPRESGAYSATWDRTDSAGGRVSAGVYFVRLKGEGFRETRKVVALD